MASCRRLVRQRSAAGVLIGLWAWLTDAPAAEIAATYPDQATVAEHTRAQLGDVTPVKRWLAGRLFVGVRTWLDAYDHRHLAPPKPALTSYPRIVGGTA